MFKRGLALCLVLALAAATHAQTVNVGLNVTSPAPLAGNLNGKCFETAGTNTSVAVDVVLSQSGTNCYAAWLAGDAGVGLSRVVATASADLGASWSAPMTVDDGLANQDNQELTSAGAVAWILCEDDRLGASVRGIYAIRSTDAGTTWGTPRRLNLTTVAGSQPRLAAASGRVHACWLQNDALLFNTSSDNGLSWSSAAMSVQGAQGGAVSAPSMCSEADRVFMCYVRGGNAVWVSRFSPLGSIVQHVQVDTTTTPSAQTSRSTVSTAPSANRTVSAPPSSANSLTSRPRRYRSDPKAARSWR